MEIKYLWLIFVLKKVELNGRIVSENNVIFLFFEEFGGNKKNARFFRAFCKKRFFLFFLQQVTNFSKQYFFV